MSNLNGGSREYLDLLNTLRETHLRKSSDYGTTKDPLDNLMECEKIGVSSITGCFVRLGDKYTRATHLIGGKDPAVVGETVTDTLLDLAGYALLTIVLINREKSKNAPATAVELVTVAKKKRKKRKARTTSGDGLTDLSPSTGRKPGRPRKVKPEVSTQE